MIEISPNLFLITVKEAANFLRLKPDTIYKKVGKNLIPHYKVGGKILFDKNELLNWIEGQKRLLLV